VGARKGVVRTRRQGSPVRTDVRSIEARRDVLFTEAAALRAAGEGARFCTNALELLTRCWSRENWRGRERLLHAAAWMLQLARSSGEASRPSFALRDKTAVVVR